MKTKRTITVYSCDNCGRETNYPSTGWLTWWEKDGLNKSFDPVEGWAEKLNCPECLRLGYEMAQVMG